MAPTIVPLVTLANRLSLAQAAQRIGKSPSCIFRWHRDGVLGVRLQCLRLGRSLATSEAALEQFGREVAAAHAAKRATTDTPPTSADNDRDATVDGL